MQTHLIRVTSHCSPQPTLSGRTSSRPAAILSLGGSDELPIFSQDSALATSKMIQNTDPPKESQRDHQWRRCHRQRVSSFQWEVKSEGERDHWGARVSTCLQTSITRLCLKWLGKRGIWDGKTEDCKGDDRAAGDFFRKNLGKRGNDEIYRGLGFLSTREGEWRHSGGWPSHFTVACHVPEKARSPRLMKAHCYSWEAPFWIWSINSTSFFSSHLPAVRHQAN